MKSTVNILFKNMYHVLSCFYTPRQRRDWCNSFGTVCVCIYMCLVLMGERTDIHRSEFWHGGQVEECVKVIGQGHLIFSAMK